MLLVCRSCIGRMDHAARIIWWNHHYMFGVLVLRCIADFCGSPEEWPTPATYHYQLRVLDHDGRTRLRRSSQRQGIGAGRPKSAKFAVALAATTSVFTGAIFMAVFFIWRSSLPKVFSENEEVIYRWSRKVGVSARCHCLLRQYRASSALRARGRKKKSAAVPAENAEASAPAENAEDWPAPDVEDWLAEEWTDPNAEVAAENVEAEVAAENVQAPNAAEVEAPNVA
ncbi:hypothetical protein BRADI_4g09301v3 [Brachypodium distachyon]|uniref:Transmembrane protein n=1 Tax=Brachypodium distachyon TaxID=15368 RepID=A0A2K2CLI5_BRADI|nr:hypothetical protein BRADI_4g09301v3 [Brachypodium distachyon]